ncbi:PadR family transcriptional regulator [Nonomuraea sp. NPDC050394]|uniref:PadR family transcriptional regulator n=1 Tax=Nonomuraea sp. NPDC050394 TaxID=3364363 RepID=UPI00379B3D00
MPRGTSEVSEPMFFVLTALLNGPLHGHAISKLIQELSNGRVRPSVGTLYGILERLHERGVIAVDREETVNGRNRRYFRITDDGHALVEAEARRMQEAAALVLRLSPGRAQAWGVPGIARG